MKKITALLGLALLAFAPSTFSAATGNTWYGDFNGGSVIRVTHIRCFNTTDCIFQVEPVSPVAAGDMFIFNQTTASGKNWLSLLATAKSTGQGVEFHTTTAYSSGIWNIDAVGLR